MLDRDISAELKDHFGQDTTTLARCWRIYRKDGNVYGFTEADQQLTIDNIVHESLNAGQMSAFESSIELSSDNSEAELLLDSSSIDAVDLRTGLFDGAKLEYFVVNYKDLSQGKFKLAAGWLGNIEMQDEEKAKVQFNSLIDTLQQVKGRQYQFQCDVKELGDDRCGVDIVGLSYNGEVSTFSNRQIFRDNNVTANNTFKFGIIQWDSGYNSGLTMEIKSFSGKATITYIDTSQDIIGVSGNETADISVGDTIEVKGSSGNDGTYTIADYEYQYAIGTITANGITDDIYNIDRSSVTIQGDPFDLQSGNEGDHKIQEGDKFEVIGTPDSDGIYECLDASYSDGITTISSVDRIPLSRDMETTLIYVEESVSSDTADGYIVVSESGRFELFLSMPFPIQKGDTFTAYPGCDRYFSTCKESFNNVVNFRGFPYIPGRDSVSRYPDSNR